MLWIGVQGKSHPSGFFLIVWLISYTRSISNELCDHCRVADYLSQAFSVWTIVWSNQVVCGWTPAFSRQGTGRYWDIPMWDLCCTKCYWEGFLLNSSVFPGNSHFENFVYSPAAVLEDCDWPEQPSRCRRLNHQFELSFWSGTWQTEENTRHRQKQCKNCLRHKWNVLFWRDQQIFSKLKKMHLLYILLICLRTVRENWKLLFCTCDTYKNLHFYEVNHVLN
jgi:hypothetical protein